MSGKQKFAVTISHRFDSYDNFVAGLFDDSEQAESFMFGRAQELYEDDMGDAPDDDLLEEWEGAEAIDAGDYLLAVVPFFDVTGGDNE